MKKHPFLLLLVAALLVAVPVLADKHKKVKGIGTPEYEARLKATMEALDTIIKTHGLNEPLEDYADGFCKEYKNDPRLAVHVAEAFSTKGGHHEIAYKRFEQIIKDYPQHADAYKEYARLLASRWDSVRAKQILDTCKIVNPTSPEPYLVWARMNANPNIANILEIDQTIELLHQKLPEFPAYLEAAQIYSDLAEYEGFFPLNQKAVDYYAKVSPKDMPMRDIYVYSFLLYKLGRKENYERGLEIAQVGAQLYNNHPTMLRMIMRNQSGLEKWEEVVATGTLFFETYDTLKLEFQDYQMYAEALSKLNNYEASNRVYEDAFNFAATEKDSTTRYRNQLTSLRKGFDNCYSAKQYKASIQACQKLMAYKAKKGKELDARDYNDLGRSYQAYAQDTLLSAEKQRESYLMADSLFAKVADISPENAILMCYKRFDIARKLYYTDDKDVRDNARDVWATEIRDAALRLQHAVETKWASQSETKHSSTEIWYMNVVYQILLLHYYFHDDRKRTLDYVNAIYDFPDSSQGNLNLANEISNAWKLKPHR